ncbi:MAG: HDOD domain-containing protein [Leptospiraceae bacterium]|nr:HDOD domain-containing protein [Leptospiraceae bacterium]MBK9502730.1 HDOD domain-containing protein [Leptospiraceae bacterium]MBL0262832.1 HDOD domain-containing protein [Leptospiraceae bacterium]MBP9162883.1 HDOD domain-containing protein [Leptospiraceae bacterium]HRG47588.1 HDOD domain-containing protein [Leptospiraceae bacterium]
MKDQIDIILKDIHKLPPMSNVVIKVMTLIQDPAVSIHDLATEISKDPAITASIIKLSNSAYYRASKPIRTVQESLMTLGIKTVKEIILLTASKKILNKDLPGYQLEAEAMWLHSLVVAELSARISIQKKTNIPKDLAFTSGLLHDIGKVILAQFFPSKILEIKQELKTSKLSFTEVERKYFGYDHQEVGMKALETWNFPEELKEVVAYHHNPELAVKFPKLVAMVHIANQISVISGIGIDIGGISHELSAQAVKILGITESDIESYYLSIPEIQKSIVDLQSI